MGGKRCFYNTRKLSTTDQLVDVLTVVNAMRGKSKSGSNDSYWKQLYFVGGAHGRWKDTHTHARRGGYWSEIQILHVGKVHVLQYLSIRCRQDVMRYFINTLH